MKCGESSERHQRKQSVRREPTLDREFPEVPVPVKGNRNRYCRRAGAKRESGKLKCVEADEKLMRPARRKRQQRATGMTPVQTYGFRNYETGGEWRSKEKVRRRLK